MERSFLLLLSVELHCVPVVNGLLFLASLHRHVPTPLHVHVGTSLQDYNRLSSFSQRSVILSVSKHLSLAPVTFYSSY